MHEHHHQRKAHHTGEVKSSLIKRLNRIEGQIRGISKMISEDIYCDDILNQMSAVDSALKGVKRLLLENHLKECVVEQIQEGRVEVVDELMITIGRMMK